ncbi:MAG: hypothetical protein ACX939_02140 [Hyphococcus sp.]
MTKPAALTLAVRRAAVAILSALCVALAPAHAEAPKPLFQDDSMLKLRIEAPFRDLVRKAATSTDPYPATLTVEGAALEQLAIELAARGNSRRNRNLCNFPPLRVIFGEKPGDASLFDGQKRLKLVTHCKNSNTFQQYYLLEYTAYKLLNVITPESLKVRLAEIDYVDTDNGKTIATRIGFFIEDTDDAAKRTGMVEIDLPDIDVDQLDAAAAGQYALFQYMIGNLDWSMHNGPDGDDCCHNTKLMGADKTATSGFIPVPYDFDYSGLVNTPYAAPPESVRVRSVRTRRYRGFCRHNADARNALQRIKRERESFYEAIAAVPGLSERSKNSAAGYLDAFFDDIETDEDVEKRLFKHCRD